MTEPLIFLDIDGVLNDTRHAPGVGLSPIRADRVERLNRILAATGAKVVLISGWRWIIHAGDMTVVGFDWLLRSHGMLSGRLIGRTRVETLDPRTGEPLVMERGLHVAEWRRDHAHAGPYVVLDDVDLGHSAAGHPFVRTDPSIGLTDGDAGAAIATLSNIRP